MPLAPDVRLGVYQILSPLGAGGMGEVYRARDTKLGRDVAIKVLPSSVAADPDRLARFEREARLLASLNHPNIGAIYGVEETAPSTGSGQPGVVALVLELVEGETLAAKLQGPGTRGLGLAEALTIARQIADALDAAHERGIVHRDLKPANIVITHDGTVKVLDFGLAKAGGAGEASQDLTHSPTVIGPTVEGVLLGTAPYMSPEQARGKPVDKRTDIWAFGCVLYEMLTGRRAFPGETASDTIAAILEREPDWTRLPASTPPPVRRLLERCLERDSKRRLRDIGDARVDLTETIAVPPEPVRRAAPHRAWMALGWAAAAIATVMAVLIARSRGGASLSPWGEVKLEPLTFDAGLTTMPALSPDGRLLAYASDRAGHGDLDIWVQQMGGGPPLRLTDDPADDFMPDFSPDGSQIVFRSERDRGGLYLVPTLGGPARRIVDDGRSPRFSPDGTRIAYWTGGWRGSPNTMTSSAFLLSLNGGAPTRILADFTGAREPVWAPDGKSVIVFARRDRTSALAEAFDWWWVPLDGRPPVRTGALDKLDLRAAIPANGFSATLLGSWTPSGVLFSAHGNLWSIPVSAETGQAGTPRPLTAGTGLYVHPAASRDGQIVFSMVEIPRVVERAPLSNDGPPVRLVSDTLSGPSRPGETADGSTLLLDRAIMRVREIWLRDVKTGSERMVVRVEDGDGPINSTISPDGTRIGYTVSQVPNEPSGTGFLVNARGGVPKRICERCTVLGFLSDNRRVLIVDDSRVRALDVVTSQTQDVLSADAAGFGRVHVTPDDRLAVFQHRGKMFVSALAPGEARTPAAWHPVDDPIGTGRPAGWSLDSRVAYLLLDVDGFRCLWGLRIEPSTGSPTGAPFPIRHFHRTMVQEFSTSYGSPITSDGFLYGGITMSGNLWRLTIPRSR